jgi:heme exporter protein A
MLALRDVEVAYGYRRVLRGVTLELAPGEGVGLVGANGAGKTTLLRVLALLLRPQRGEVELDGRTVTTEAVAERRRIGFLSHQLGLYDVLTGREHLVLQRDLFGAPADVGEWLKAAGLALAADEPVATYSRGMRQRLALARVLLPQPDYLLLDEPFSGLDRDGAAWLTAELVQCRRRGQAVLLVSHERESLTPVIGRTLTLARGRLRSEAGP